MSPQPTHRILPDENAGVLAPGKAWNRTRSFGISFCQPERYPLELDHKVSEGCEAGAVMLSTRHVTLEYKISCIHTACDCAFADEECERRKCLCWRPGWGPSELNGTDSRIQGMETCPNSMSLFGKVPVLKLLNAIEKSRPKGLGGLQAAMWSPPYFYRLIQEMSN